MSGILIGYEVGNGEPISIEASHMVVCGITNQTGKTTFLEGMASRAKGFKFLVFKTKPHEQQFVRANLVKPFFRERTDWEYVAGILEASRNERMKFERFWIMRASKGTRTLHDVDANCQELMKEEKEGGLAYSMYYQLHEYFKNILPELEHWHLGETFPELSEGINVMDLGGMSDGVQMLVIESCLSHILKSEKHLITIIPELWKFSPEGKHSPVKDHLDRLIRQGAAGSNFVWFDSQDMAGVDKGPLKQCYTWILGLQMERNEIRHTLDQINVPKNSKPTADQISSLRLGHFYLSTPRGVRHFYAAPIWLPEEKAVLVAKGQLQPDDAQIKEFKDFYDKSALSAGPTQAETTHLVPVGSDVSKEVANIEEMIMTLRDSVKILTTQIEVVQRTTQQQGEALRKLEERPAIGSAAVHIDNYQTQLEITDRKEPVNLTTKNNSGKIAYTVYKILEGKPAFPWEIAKAALEKRGWKISSTNFKRDVSSLLEQGILIISDGKYGPPEEHYVEIDGEKA